MNKRLLSCFMTCCFFVAFAFSGITATTTVKDMTVTTTVSLPSVLYSVSSTATLLLPLLLVLAIIALISFWGKQINVGFLFLLVAVALYAAFLLAYCNETQNYALYNTLSAMLKEAGVKGVRKRDVLIRVVPQPLCYVTLLLGVLALAASFPHAGTRQERFKLARELEPYAFIAPHLLLFIIFFFIPALYGIYAAFTKWDIYNAPVFVGFSNFKTLLFDSSNTYFGQLRNGLWNTLEFVLLSVPLCIAVPLLIALALRTGCRGNKFFQGIYYLPSLMSASSVMLAWDYFFKKTYGMANNLFGSTANWFAPPYSWVMIVLITLWWCNGTNMVIYQSALASIPTDHYEAASIDGANGWKQFWYITLPGIRYPLSYTLATTLIAQFNIYAQVEMLLGYTNSEANAVLMMYIRDAAFSQSVAGMASAMALILGLCIALITLMQVRMMREKG